MMTARYNLAKQNAQIIYKILEVIIRDSSFRARDPDIEEPPDIYLPVFFNKL